VLLLDKPRGLSSNEAMLRVRGFYQADKAGHTGTLDPLATGLLPVCLGQATKLTSHLLDARKRYIAEVRLGARTTTGDSEGEVLETSEPQGLDEAVLRAALSSFRGPIRQIPPMYSALKRDGQRLYELARAGVEVEREPREVDIHHLELLSFDGLTALLDVSCSKGTYIRTLAEDWARSFGQAAHLQALRRTEVGPFQPQIMVTLEQLAQAAAEGVQAIDALLLPARTALAGWTFLRVDEAQVTCLSRGASVLVAGAVPGAVAIEDEQSRLLGLGEIDPQGRLQPRRWFGAI